MRDLKELVAELDVVKTWFSAGSARHRAIVSLSDELAEHAGGRIEAKTGDPSLATPGPGVRSATAQVTEVDSVGQVADVPDPAEQRRAEAAAAAEAAKQAEQNKNKQPNG